MSQKKAKLYWETVHKEKGTGLGDDAQPYTGQNLISVADGSGGIAYPLHPDINHMLFDRSKSFETAVSGIISYESSDWDLWKSQYDENFFTELYDLSKDYKDSKGRKSCYFGSRLTSIFMRKILEEKFPSGKLEKYMEELAVESDDDRNIRLQLLGKELSRLLYENMKQAANNCGLAFGTRDATANLQLMATTYTGILFIEKAEYVDSLTVQAGDSLPYAIVLEDEIPVLKLLQKGQNNKDGSLTNVINADVPFDLVCTYRRIPKPCILFCVSDGCTCGFSTPAHFECYFQGLFADALRNNNMDSIAEVFSSLLSRRGTFKDDSASMAIIFFDFDNEDLCSKMKYRQNSLLHQMDLNNRFMYSQWSPPEDKLREYNIQWNNILLDFKDEFWHNSGWIQAQYIEDKNELETEINYLQQELKKNWNQLEAELKENWDSIKKILFYPTLSTEVSEHHEIEEKDGFETIDKLQDSDKGSEDLLDNANQDQIHSADGAASKNKNEVASDAETQNKAESQDETPFRLQNNQEPYELTSENSVKISKKMIFEDRNLIRLICLSLFDEIPSPMFDTKGDEDSDEKKQIYADSIKSAIDNSFPDYADIAVDEIKNISPALKTQNIDKIVELSPKILYISNAYKKTKIQLYNHKIKFEETCIVAYKKFIDRPLAPIRDCWLEHRDSIDSEFIMEIEKGLAPIEEKINSIRIILETRQTYMRQFNDAYFSYIDEGEQR